MSFSGTELVYEDDTDEGEENVISRLSPTRVVREHCDEHGNANHDEHETQTSLSMTITPLSKANGKNLSVDHMHIVTPSASMQSAPTEYSIGQNHLYFSSLKVTEKEPEDTHHHSLTIDTLPLFEDDRNDDDGEHAHTNSISISSKADSLNTSIVYHDSANEEDQQQRIFHSHLPNESVATADSTFDGMDTSKFMITACKQKKKKKSRKCRDISTDEDEDEEDEEGDLVILNEDEYHHDDEAFRSRRSRASSVNSAASTINHLLQRHRPPEHIMRRIAQNQSDRDTETDAERGDVLATDHDADTDPDPPLRDEEEDEVEQEVNVRKERRNSLHIPCYTNEFNGDKSETGLTDTALGDDSVEDGQHDARDLADFMANRTEEDTAEDRDEELSDRVTLQMERKWLNQFNQQKRESEAKILSLQEQLTNLARQLQETQRMQHQFQLMNHTPLQSNRTQRISVSNTSVLGRLTDEDEYNDSEDDMDPNTMRTNNKRRGSVHINDRERDTNKDKEGEDGHKSAVTVSESPLVRIFDIPSFHSLFSRYSASNSDTGNDDREPETPNEAQVPGTKSRAKIVHKTAARSQSMTARSTSKRKKHKMPLPPIKTDIVAQAVVRSAVFKHVTPRTRSRDRRVRKKKRASMSKSTSKSTSKPGMLHKYSNVPTIRKLSSPKTSVSQRCRDVVENEYVKRKQEKKKQSLLWGWFASYTCHDFANCFRKSEHVLPGILIHGGVGSETANVSYSYREKLPPNITPL